MTTIKEQKLSQVILRVLRQYQDVMKLRSDNYLTAKQIGTYKNQNSKVFETVSGFVPISVKKIKDFSQPFQRQD